MLSSLELSRRAVSRLTSLFQTAKFSHHEVDTGMKEEAIDALVSARDELRAARERAEAERRAALERGRRAGRRVRAALVAGDPDRSRSRRSALAIALALIPSRAELLVHVWLLVLLASVALAGLGALRRAYPRRGAVALRPPAAATRQAQRTVSLAGADRA